VRRTAWSRGCDAEVACGCHVNSILLGNARKCHTRARYGCPGPGAEAKVAPATDCSVLTCRPVGGRAPTLPPLCDCVMHSSTINAVVALLLRTYARNHKHKGLAYGSSSQPAILDRFPAISAHHTHKCLLTQCCRVVQLSNISIMQRRAGPRPWRASIARADEPRQCKPQQEGVAPSGGTTPVPGLDAACC
jgi:hypothetical protein